MLFRSVFPEPADALYTSKLAPMLHLFVTFRVKIRPKFQILSDDTGLDATQIEERQRFHRAHHAPALTVRADDIAALGRGGAHLLAGNLHQTKAGNAADIHLGLVALHARLDLTLHFLDVLLVAHVDGRSRRQSLRFFSFSGLPFVNLLGFKSETGIFPK